MKTNHYISFLINAALPSILLSKFEMESKPELIMIPINIANEFFHEISFINSIFYIQNGKYFTFLELSRNRKDNHTQYHCKNIKNNITLRSL